MKRIGVVVLVCILLALTTTPVFAADEPNSVALSNITIYEDLIVDGDMLAIVHYSIPFTTTPDNPIGELFIFRMISDNGTDVGASVPYPYSNYGYGSGIVSFYLQSGGVWEEDYTFRVQQNPAYYDTPQYWDFDIGPGNYESATSQSTALKSKIVGLGTTLSIEYELLLLSTYEGVTQLSTYGEQYFLNSIPGLAIMCPTLFSVQVRTPDYTKRSWDYTLANALKTKYDDTFIADFMTGYAGLTTSNTETAMNMLSIILFVILFLVSVRWFKANTYSGMLDGYTLLILLMLNSFFPMVLTGFIAFILVVFGGVILFLNRS